MMDAAATTTTTKPTTRWWPRLNGHRAATWLLSVWTLFVLGVAALLWSMAAVRFTHGSFIDAPSWYLSGVYVAFGTFALLMARGHFRTVMVLDASSRITKITASAAIACTSLVMLIAALPISQPTYGLLAGLFVTLVVAGLLAHVVAVRSLRRAWLRGRLRENALIYGTDRLAAELAIEIDFRPEFGIDVVGFVSGSGHPAMGGHHAGAEMPGPVFSADDDLDVLVARTQADRLIIGPGTTATDRRAIGVARHLSAAGIAVFAVPRFFEMGLGADLLSPDRARGYPLVRLQRSAHPQVSIRLKRAFDVTVAVGLLIALSPLIAVVTALVRVTSPGPVLFRQTRIGQHGRTIVVRKFRSMRMSATSDREWTADDRITWIGRWLRRLNLDELPQLYSVVVGEMSLVGPRPERPVFVERFRATIPDYDERHRVPVGITGLAQIAGLRGDTSIAERVKYDNLYIDQWSFRSDLHILAKTVSAIITQRADADRLVELERALEPSIDLRDDLDLGRSAAPDLAEPV